MMGDGTCDGLVRGAGGVYMPSAAAITRVMYTSGVDMMALIACWSVWDRL